MLVRNLCAVESGSSSIQEKILSKSLGVGKNQQLDAPQITSSLPTNPSGSRPSSNYGSRSQVIGPQKGNMHWPWLIWEMLFDCGIEWKYALCLATLCFLLLSG